MDEKFEKIKEAFNIAKQNSYLRCLFGDTQLFYMFMEGMKYQKTGELPNSLLEDKDFIAGNKKFNKE